MMLHKIMCRTSFAIDKNEHVGIHFCMHKEVIYEGVIHEVQLIPPSLDTPSSYALK